MPSPPKCARRRTKRVTKPFRRTPASPPSFAACHRPPSAIQPPRSSHGHPIQSQRLGSDPSTMDHEPNPSPHLQLRGLGPPLFPDRKSTRLNSSHEWISYAVFCLKKKK